MKPTDNPSPAIDLDSPTRDDVLTPSDGPPRPGAVDSTTRPGESVTESESRTRLQRGLALDPGPGPSMSFAFAIVEGPGTSIGPYKLIQRIGEGGMGTVFLAEQERPIRREVALKVIKLGMDTGQVIARFEAERQALALMDHPNIARVLDAGATDTGRPFFVMELVRGVPITEYCDQNRLTLKERLELFVPVCRAIQHAHQKGIIHRDIKPSNVLITLSDGVAEVRVIDFGVAKATEQRLTDRTFFTEYGVLLGTLEYMSPEQAEMGALDIDTRSDVYSLGVLLYELLTGTTPLEKARSRWVAPADLLRRVRDDEPPRPSTRLSELKDRLASIAACRQMEPARLTNFVRGDLDWIVMKALEKDRTRRYETAIGLARDVQRYLGGDAIEARPSSASYKVGKFARKHHVALVTTAAFVGLLVAATAISASLAVRANAQRARAGIAEKSAEEQRDRALNRERLAVRERLRAEKAEESAEDRQGRAADRERLAIDAVRRFSDTVRDTPELKNNPKLAPLRQKLLKEPQSFFQRLRDRLQANQETTPESLALLAAANFDLGKLTDDIGDRLDALKAWDESRLLWERLVRDDPSNTRYQADLANNHVATGNLQRYLNRLDQALASFQAALGIYERLTRDHPANLEFQQNLAWSRAYLAGVQTDMGRTIEASASLAAVHAVRERLALESPADTRFQFDLAASCNDIGELHRSRGRTAEALAAHQQARSICGRLTRDHPTDVSFQNELATSLQHIGETQAKDERMAEALTSHEQARSIWERLARDHPSSARPQSGLISCHYYIGNIYFKLGNWAESAAAFERRRAIYERLAHDDPTNPKVQSQLAICHTNDGLVSQRANRPAEAIRSFELGRSIRERLVLDDPADTRTRNELAMSNNTLGEAHRQAARAAEALSYFEQARSIAERLTRDDPANPRFLDRLINAEIGLSLAYRDQGQPAEASLWRQRARTTQAERSIVNPDVATIDARLTAVLKGESPHDNTERLALAVRAYEKRWPAASASLYAEALANDSHLTVDRKSAQAYNAACSATLAATGRGCDDPPPDQATQAQFRRQALTWLQAELTAWTKVAEADDPHSMTQVLLAMNHWREDDDLIGLREDRDLDQLPEPERSATRRFWVEVDHLLGQVSNHP